MTVTTADFYNSGARHLQRLLGTSRLAGHIARRYAASVLDESATALVGAADCFYLATADAQGRPDCSYKGGLPGFVQVPDPAVLLFPSYDGNGMFRSLGNILENPAVGLLFLDYGKPGKLRINGDATVSTHPDLLARFHEADAVVRVDVRQVFENCPRYLHSVEVRGHSPHVPQPGYVPPDPDWKLKPEYEGLVRLRSPR